MCQDDLVIHMFCFIDDQLKALNLGRLRQRGPAPTLADSEVIAIEASGELLGIDADKQIFSHFRQRWADLFPGLRRVDRTRFVRQAADLWRVKQLLQERLVQHALAGLEPLWVLDSFPLPLCRFARAPGCRRLAGVAAYGFDHTQKGLYYGLRVHLRVAAPGLVAGFDLAPANVHDTDLAPELLPAGGTGLGDRNYWDPLLMQELAGEGRRLIAPFKKESSDPWPARSALIARLRQIIEPVIGQLAVRLSAKRTWARDLWHLTARLARKVLAHTAAVILNTQAGNPPLRLELLIE